jgi:two-component system sensor histidine kinase EvgS
MDEYLSKPVAIAELVAALQRWLPHTAPDPYAVAPARPAPGAADIATAGDTPRVSLPQVSGEPLPLDPAVLAPLTGGDPAATRELLDDYVEATEADLRALRAAQAAGDLHRIAHEAHKLKGAARLVGAHPLATAAAALEAAAKDGDWAGVLPHATDVGTAFERLKLHLGTRS